MANLSSDLNSYLSRSTSNSSLNSVTSKLSTFKLPTLDTIKSFGGGGAQQEDEEPFLGVQVVETQHVEFQYLICLIFLSMFRLTMEVVTVVDLKAGLAEKQTNGFQV